MAGESADEVARAARDKAQRLLRHSAAYAKGAAGERATAAVLATLPPTWTVLHDLRWPGRQRANIDHVAIGPSGVFVIDSKNWAGQITLTGRVLRQNGYARTQSLESVTEATEAIRALVPSLAARAFVPVLCLVRDEAIAEQAAGVAVCTTATLVSVLTERPAVLGTEWLEFLRFELDMSTQGAGDPSDAPDSEPGPVVVPRQRREPVVPPRRPRTTTSAPPPGRTRAQAAAARARRRRRRALTDLVSGLLGVAVLLGAGEYLAHRLDGAPATNAPAHHTARHTTGHTPKQTARHEATTHAR